MVSHKAGGEMCHAIVSPRVSQSFLIIEVFSLGKSSQVSSDKQNELVKWNNNQPLLRLCECED